MRYLNYFRLTIIVFVIAFLSACSKKNSDNPQPQPQVSQSITSLNVNKGPFNTQVTINGTGFGSEGTSSVVLFNDKVATINSWTDTKIVAVVPIEAGTGVVTVVVKGVVLTGPVFTYQYSAYVSTLSLNGTFLPSNESTNWPYFSSSYGIAFDIAGNIYVSNSNISDSKANTIVQFSPNGTWSYIGSGGSGISTDGRGTAASFTMPGGMISDGSNNIYVADVGEIRKVNSDGTVTNCDWQ